MRTVLIAFALAFLASLLLTWAVREIARRYGLYDQQGGRKIHRGDIPRVGGIAVTFAFAVPLVALYVWGNKISTEIFRDQPMILALILGRRDRRDHRDRRRHGRAARAMEACRADRRGARRVRGRRPDRPPLDPARRLRGARRALAAGHGALVPRRDQRGQPRRRARRSRRKRRRARGRHALRHVAHRGRLPGGGRAREPRRQHARLPAVQRATGEHLPRRHGQPRARLRPGPRLGPQRAEDVRVVLDHRGLHRARRADLRPRHGLRAAAADRAIRRSRPTSTTCTTSCFGRA